MDNQILRWGLFHVFVLVLLLLDLGFFHRGKKIQMTWKRAVVWSCGWIGVSLLFNLYVYWSLGTEKALEFFTGYLIEKSLSIDNLFVFILIFNFFQVPKEFHHRALFYGIAGACIFRLSLILGGISIIQMFHWILYLFGILILLTGIRLIRQKIDQVEATDNFIIRWMRKHLPITKTYRDGSFFVRIQGKLWLTPLFLTLVAVETTDILFALDSIPAIFAITLDPFIIYTSNVFAILGLRALHFIVMHLYHQFRYLKIGLGALLIFIGGKMLLEPVFPISLLVSLGVVIVILAISIAASIYYKDQGAAS